MKLEVEDLEWELKSLQLRNELLEKLRDVEVASERERRSRATMESTCTQAVKVHREFSIIAGLSRFKLSQFSPSRLNFDFVGSCPAACFSVSFNLQDSTSVTCRAEANPEAFQRLERSSRALPSRFFEMFTPIVCAEVSDTTLSSAAMVGEYLRRVDWHVCRLEETAAEVQHLRRRYKVTEEEPSASSTSDSGYTVRVDFYNRSQEPQLSVYFDIGRAYPFSWVNNKIVCNDNAFNIEWLERYLCQHSKAGPGWLSRTCDTISAVCQGCGNLP
jgi:hypothetical protein